MTINFFNHFFALVYTLSLVISLFTQYNVALTAIVTENEVHYHLDHGEITSNRGIIISSPFTDELLSITHPIN